MEAAEQITQRKHVQEEQNWTKNQPLRYTTQQGNGRGNMIINADTLLDK